MLPSKVLPAEEAAGYRGNNGGEGLKSVIESSLHRIDPELGAISGITKADISHKFSAITVYMVDNKWFAKFVSGGLAILSIVDMVLDLVMIARFHAAGKSGYATATTVCLSLCLVLQVAFTYVQNCKRSWRRIIGEVREGWSEGRLERSEERSDSKIIIPPSYITNNPSTRCFAPRPRHSSFFHFCDQHWMHGEWQHIQEKNEMEKILLTQKPTRP